MSRHTKAKLLWAFESSLRSWNWILGMNLRSFTQKLSKANESPWNVKLDHIRILNSSKASKSPSETFPQPASKLHVTQLSHNLHPSRHNFFIILDVFSNIRRGAQRKENTHNVRKFLKNLFLISRLSLSMELSIMLRGGDSRAFSLLPSSSSSLYDSFSAANCGAWKRWGDIIIYSNGLAGGRDCWAPLGILNFILSAGQLPASHLTRVLVKYFLVVSTVKLSRSSFRS